MSKVDAGVGIFYPRNFYNDIIIAPESLGTGATPPDPETFLTTLRAYCFDGTATAEQIFGSFEIPHDYAEGTPLDAHVHWSPTTTGTGNVKWNMEYSIAPKDGVFPAVTPIAGTAAAGGVADVHKFTDIGTIPGTDLKVGAVCCFRLFRNPADSADTYEADARLLSIGFHYQSDSAGSRGEYTK